MSVPPDGVNPIEALSPRETDVLRLVASGRPDAEIAYELVLTQDGVDSYMRQAMAKLGVETREEAAAIWTAQRRRER